MTLDPQILALEQELRRLQWWRDIAHAMMLAGVVLIVLSRLHRK